MTYSATVTDAPPPKPKLYRDQLTELFRANGLPALSVNYLNKIASLGEGPPVAIVFSRRPMYDPDEALAWMRERAEEQTRAWRERLANNRSLAQRLRAKRAREAEAVGEQRKAAIA
jgi:hypothetical protein